MLGENICMANLNVSIRIIEICLFKYVHFLQLAYNPILDVQGKPLLMLTARYCNIMPRQALRYNTFTNTTLSTL